MSVSASEMRASLGALENAPPEASVRELILQPRKGWIAIDFRELFQFRELLFYLIWRDVKVRYKQTVLGVAWAVLQPLFNTIIMTVIFSKLAGLGKGLPDWLPYPVWLYTGMMGWTLISTAISLGGMSLVNAQNLVTKIYFPRLFVPAAVIGGALVDMAISFGLFVLIALWYHSLGHLNPWGVVLVPYLLALSIMISLGFSYALSALTVTYRDFRFVVPFMAQAMMYLSAVMIPLEGGVYRWRYILSINPCFGVLVAYRTAFFGLDWQPGCLAISTLTTCIMFIFGVFYFRKTERRFADVA
jgi:lipopolysaccharide transport system permease protein